MTIFSTLDAHSGYCKVEIAKEDREKTSFVTHHGLIQFIQMQFGLEHASEASQHAIDVVLSTVQ